MSLLDEPGVDVIPANVDGRYEFPSGKLFADGELDFRPDSAETA
jgi:hypothetical protein